MDGLRPGYSNFAAPSHTAVFTGFIKAAGATQSQYASFKFADLDGACAGARAEEVTDLASIKQVGYSRINRASGAI